METFSKSSFQDVAGVSRETLEKLSLYVDLLQKWQVRFNLVGPSTLQNIWRRHMLDSSRLFPYITKGIGSVLDLGSGAGFPGLVLSIMGLPNVVLLESNRKKCGFLKEVIRETACNTTVFNGRVEEYSKLHSAQYVTSRALASLDDLLIMSHPLLASSGSCLFLKGERYEEELTLATKKWSMDVIIHPSNYSRLVSNGVFLKPAPPGVLIEIRNLSPRD